MSTIVFHGSTRKNSNTEMLTYAALPKKQGTHVYLRDYTVYPIIDQRHDTDGFTPVNDDHKKLIDLLLEHDTIIFATPIYWYSMSVLTKLFIDRWSQVLRDPDYPDFREKLSQKKVYVIIVGGDNPFIKGLPLIQQFQYICDFYKMHFAGYIIGKASKPGDILHDKRALQAASTLLTPKDNGRGT